MADSIQNVDTRTFAKLWHAREGQIIDARSAAAYNGWALEGEPRGGHIPGARSLPLEWTRYIDWVEAVDHKGIDPLRPTVVYGRTPDQAGSLAEHLLGIGFAQVSVYPHFADQWLPDARNPLERLARYQQLVPSLWLEKLVCGQSPPAAPAKKWVLCHAHFDHEADYEQGHIPGAIPLNTNWLESTETWDRRAPEELCMTLLSLGISRDTTVIVYGRFSYPRYEDEHPGKRAGHLGAMRCAAIMLYAGVEDVRILDGGMNFWEQENLPTSTERFAPRPIDEFGAELRARPEYMIDTPQARRLLESDDAALVSVRSWAEYIGEFSGYHYIRKKGRIPGAVFGDCGSDAYHMENYRNLDHTMREAPEIANRWAASGITPDKRIAFYCGTGWRGSEAFMCAYLMSWPRISIYDGGWFAWSSDPANPIATGPPASP